MQTSPEITIAISAIPNSGKTTLFNRLTGTNQTVGNWAGVSVEKKVGRFNLDGFQVRLVDLPGAYSITPSSQEEEIVRNYFLDSPPDIILNVVEAANLYRGLGMTLQLCMSGIPMVLAVNMMDEARRQGIEIDFKAFSRHLGIPVVPLVARTGEGIAELKIVLLNVLGEKDTCRAPHISLPPILEQAITDLCRQLEGEEILAHLDKRFVALRLMEGGEAAERLVRAQPSLQKVLQSAQARRAGIEKILKTDLITVCAQCRFNSARGLTLEVSKTPKTVPTAITEKIDYFLMHRLIGLPLFFAAMFLLFEGVFVLGAPLQDWIGTGIGLVQSWLKNYLSAAAWPPIIIDFLIDGVIEGGGVVASFFPIIALFFIFLSVIEDTGYMARAAFLMDRIMHALKLDGKAFISLFLGYGCNVPAIMSTRILPGRHSRLLTMLLVPFTLCTARLQIFVFLSAILFAPSTAPLIVFSLYVGSFVIILLAGVLLKPFHLGGDPEPFIMEVPPYRLPLLRTVLLRSWMEVKEFLYRAATLIIAGVAVVWFLTHYPGHVPPGSAETLAGRMGKGIAILLDPIGIHWQESVALMFGFIAKEIVIGAMAVIYGSGADLAGQVSAHLSPLRGLSLMVFTLIYTPCVATLAVIHTESKSWRITGLSVLLGLGLAWTVSFIVYQGGLMLGFK
jgi:ferrous iron transport protein B